MRTGPTTPFSLFVLLILVHFACSAAAADVVEFTSGAKLEGEITARDDKMVTVEVLLGGRTFTRTYPLERVHALTTGGRREVLHPLSGTRTAAPQPAAPVAPGIRRSRAEVEALIAEAGRTKPEWWDSVELNYPQSLDLAWPTPPPPPWNNQRNVGQYVWDVINPNPARWREGVRFMDHVLTVNRDKPRARWQATEELGRMYFNLLQDYPRAAYWWRQARVDQPDVAPQSGLHLAECYWRMGNEQMAMDLVEKLPPQYATIKLWADMGELRLALALADANTTGPAADLAYIYAGDACRVAGQFDKALDYYQRLLALPAGGQGAERIKRNQERARANVEAIRLFDTLDIARVPDGIYRASSLGYEAQVHVEVTVRGGRIESVRVVEHREKQFYSAMIDTPKKIIDKQAVKGIDATSGATITSEAIINATAKALSAAQK